MSRRLEPQRTSSIEAAARRRPDGNPSLVERVGDLAVIRSVDPSGAPIAAGVSGAPGTALRGYRLVGLGLVGSDALCVLAALWLSHLIQSGAGSLRSDFLVVVAVAPLCWVGVFQAFGLYGVQHLSALEEFHRVLSATAVGTVLIFIGGAWWEESVSRVSLGSVLLLALFFELLARRLWRLNVRRSKRDGRLALRTLIVGTNEEAKQLAIALSPAIRGFAPVGYVAASSALDSPDGLPVVGRMRNLEEIIRDRSIECVFVASTAVSAHDMVRISRACRQANIEMRVSAKLPEVLTSRLTIQQIDRVLALTVRPVRLSRAQAALKRTFDLVAASAALVVALPLMAVIGLAVRLTSSGAALFRQVRITKAGRPFTMYKFRTMARDVAEGEASPMDLSRPFFKMQNDPRLTAVGRVLRSLSLDELPQLWNVIRGDMSLVGPRPLPSDQVSAHRQLLSPRHEVRAGLTGWWQINGRSDVEHEEALRLDLFYVENWSLTLDLYILLKTVGAVIGRKGAL